MFIRDDVLAVALEYIATRGIELIGAPYEADFQLAALEQWGEVDAVYSEDSDLFILGVETLIMNLKTGGGGQCAIVKRAVSITKPEIGGGNCSLLKLAAFADFSGCDFLAKVAHMKKAPWK